jgi:hypothetical protein
LSSFAARNCGWPLLRAAGIRGAEKAPECLAVEPDGVVEVARVGQLALLAKMVNTVSRAAEQRGDLRNVE